MKKIQLTQSLFIAGLATCLLSSGCDNRPAAPAPASPAAETAKAPPPPPPGIPLQKPAEPNGFEAVVSKLDVGGPFLLYVSTDQALTNLSGELDSWKPIVQKANADEPEAVEKSNLLFKIVAHLIQRSGFEELDGIGISLFPSEPGVTRGKLFVQHPKQDLSNTLIWNVCGAKAHPIPELKLLPSNTVVAYFTDFDVKFLWNFIKTELEALPEKEGAEDMAEFQTDYEKNTNLKWDQTLDSLGNQIGFVMTLDPAKKFTIPESDIVIDEPGVAIIFKTKSDLLFKKIDELLPAAQMPITKSDENGVQMRSTELPADTLGIQLSPTIAQTSEYLIISSTTGLVKAMLDSASGKVPGLTTTSEEYKKLRANTPDDGNAFSFLSAQFGATMQAIQKAGMKEQDKLPPEAMDKFMSTYKTPASFTISAHVEDGWYSVTNTASGISNLVQPFRSLPGFLLTAGLLSNKRDLPDVELEESPPTTPPPAGGE